MDAGKKNLNVAVICHSSFAGLLQIYPYQRGIILILFIGADGMMYHLAGFSLLVESVTAKIR